MIYFDMEQERLKRLEKFINHLPEPEQKRAIIVVDDKLFSWKAILEELKKGGDLANKIEKKFEERLK